MHTFHQAEVLWVDEGLDEWQMMGRIAGLVDRLTGGARLRVLQVHYPLWATNAGRGWEVAVQWPGEEWASVCGWCRFRDALVEHLGLDPARWSAIGLGMGLERLACLRYGIDDVRKVEAVRL